MWGGGGGGGGRGYYSIITQGTPTEYDFMNYSDPCIWGIGPRVDCARDVAVYVGLRGL